MSQNRPEEEGQRPGKKALKGFALCKRHRGKAASFQRGGTLAKNAETAPGGAGRGQGEAGTVRGEKGRHGKQLHRPHCCQIQRRGKKPEGPGEHIEKHHEAADGNHGGSRIPDGRHKGGGEGRLASLRNGWERKTPLCAAPASKEQPRQQSGEDVDQPQIYPCPEAAEDALRCQAGGASVGS